MGATIKLTRLGSECTDDLSLGPAGTTDNGAGVRIVSEPRVSDSSGVLSSLSVVCTVIRVFVVGDSIMCIGGQSIGPTSKIVTSKICHHLNILRSDNSPSLPNPTGSGGVVGTH